MNGKKVHGQSIMAPSPHLQVVKQTNYNWKSVGTEECASCYTLLPLPTYSLTHCCLQRKDIIAIQFGVTTELIKIILIELLR